jgi:hypothetical protein
MIPIDCVSNPWKSTYPSITVQNQPSISTRSLYHAILAQAAYNLANLKGPGMGVWEKASAMRYFALSNVVAQTVSDCSAVSTDTIAEVYDVLTTVMTRSKFGYTIGATARLIKEICQIRLLEEQITMAGYTMGSQGLNEDMIVQVERII